jgi:hypothetical protein
MEELESEGIRADQQPDTSKEAKASGAMNGRLNRSMFEVCHERRIKARENWSLYGFDHSERKAADWRAVNAKQ